MREGFHLFLQSAAPDAVAVGFNDSPAGLAAWLVEKYRRWSDCDGEIERRFSKDQLCDLLTIYWATGTIASSMRLYLGERRNRWRFGEGERIAVPAAAADFPGEIVRPPREWAERIFSDLRRWTEMPRGGHFAALEEPRPACRRPDRVPGRRLIARRPHCWENSGPMAFRVLAADDAHWRPSNQMGVLNTDLAKQLATKHLGARLWRLEPGQASTKHRHRTQEELYVLLQGSGRARIGDEILTLEPLGALVVDPGTVRQLFNDTDDDQLWLVVGAPRRRPTRSR